MYYDLFFKIYLLGRLQGLLLVIGIPLLVITAIAFIGNLVEEEQFVVWLFVLAIIALLMVVAGAMMPSDKEMITMFALKNIDTYNTANASSMLSTQEFIGVVNNVLSTVSEAVSKFIK